MSSRYLPLLATVLTASMHTTVSQFTPPPVASNSALGALGLLPPQFQGNIVKISADNGNPDPPEWYFLAYRGSPEGGLFSLTVAGGQIVQEKPSLNLGELFKNPNPVAVERMTIDSPAAFEIARQFAEANDKHLDTVSYVLQQTGSDSTPIWQVWCYDREGRYFGYLQIAATDGAVISTEGLPRAP